MKKGDHLFLVDGSGFIFRAFHAIPPLNRKSDGLPVNAVSGFLQHAVEAAARTRATPMSASRRHISRSSSTIRRRHSATSSMIRVQGQPHRAAGRPGSAIRPDPPRDERAFNLPCIETEGFEADDLIATYARLAEADGARRHHRSSRPTRI
jgi:DNA polymerase-1